MISNLVGNRIRELRAKLSMTQQQLADMARIPRATLATIEKDDTNPSLSSVYRISLALETTIDDLLESQHNRIETIRSSDMSFTQSGDGLYCAKTISPNTNPAFSQLIFDLEPGATYSGKPHPPGSEEFLHILAGEVQIEVAGEKVRLKTGDSAHFRGNITHSYTNLGTRAARGSVVIVEISN